MIKKFHLLPTLKIGGIETMMAKFLAECPTQLDYHLVVLDKPNEDDVNIPPKFKENIIFLGRSSFLLTQYTAIKFVLQNRKNIIITSTWRSALIVFIVSMFCSLPFHLSFTHRSTSAHRLDRFFREWQVKNCLLCVADSESALSWVQGTGSDRPIQVIHPVFLPISTKKQKNITESIKICFLGRLAPVKNISTICRFIDILIAKKIEIEFSVYGPKGGAEHVLTSWIASRLESGITLDSYKGPVQYKDVSKVISQYDFIISCSHTEGFAMSIAEAMQLGVVPIVGNIGGPSSYCTALNSILLSNYEDTELVGAADRTLEVWSNKSIYQSMSKAAKSTFHENKMFTTQYVKLLSSIESEIQIQNWS